MDQSVCVRNEVQMVAAILGGDTHRYRELIEPYERKIYRIALVMIGNEADAEDVAQEALIKGFHHLKSFRGESRFSTWLISIVLNEGRALLRKRKSFRTESFDELREDWIRSRFQALDRLTRFAFATARTVRSRSTIAGCNLGTA